MDIGGIAQGEEAVSQLTKIKTLYCDFGQGYLLSMPVGSYQARTLIGAKPVLRDAGPA